MVREITLYGGGVEWVRRFNSVAFPSSLRFEKLAVPVPTNSHCHGRRMNQLVLFSGTRDDDAIQWRACTHTRADELLDVRPNEA